MEAWYSNRKRQGRFGSGIHSRSRGPSATVHQADAAGNIYGAEVGPKALKKYVKK
jgi:hypothetical protein